MAMSISSTLIFQSVAFPPEEGEDEQTNPGIFGRNLAHWVSGFLNEAGIAAGDVIPEDFGWCVPVETTPHHTFVACCSA